MGLTEVSRSAEAESLAGALLSSSEPPDAIAAMKDDKQATGVMRAVQAAGRTIPDR